MARNNNRTKKSNPKGKKGPRKETPLVKRKKKLGLRLSSTGNVLIPSSGMDKFHSKLLKDSEVFESLLNQRRAQLNNGGTPIKGSLVDEIVCIEEDGIPLEEIIDLLDCDRNLAENNVTIFSATPFIPALRKFASGPTMAAISRGIELVNELVGISGENYSVGQLAFLRLLLECYYYLKGRIPTLAEQHPVVNRFLATLSPRECQEGDQSFAFVWEGLGEEFDDFFSAGDQNPNIGNSVTIGGLTTDGTLNYSKTRLITPLTEEQILEFGTEAYMKVITQLSVASGASLVDPLMQVRERSISAAWSVPTGFGGSESSFRYWANVRNLIKVHPRDLPYACSGFLDTASISVDVETVPVRSIQHVNMSHFFHQMNNPKDFFSTKAVLVYPKIVFIEQILTRWLAAMILGDVKVTDNPPDYNAKSLTQSDISVFHGLSSYELAMYVTTVVTASFTDSWIGCFALPEGVMALAGTCFTPNAFFRAAPIIMQIAENLEMCGASKKWVQGQYGESFERVTVPVLASDGNYNAANFSGNSLQQFIAGMFPGIPLGSISYEFDPLLANTLIPVGIIPVGRTNEFVCVTNGPVLQSIFREIGYAMNTLQPAVVLTVFSGTHANTYSYDSMTRLSTRPAIAGASAYRIFNLNYTIASTLNKWMLGPNLLDIVPVFILGYLTDDPGDIMDLAANASAMFSQAHRIPYSDVGGLDDLIKISDFDYEVAPHMVGSLYEPPQTGLTFIYQKRLVDGDGGFWAVLKMGVTGVEHIAAVSAKLLEYFEKHDAAKVMNTISKSAKAFSPFLGNSAVIRINSALRRGQRPIRARARIRGHESSPKKEEKSDLAVPPGYVLKRIEDDTY